MKKSLILVVAVLFCVVGWAGASYLVGAKAEAEYHSYIEEYGQLGPLKLSSRSYQRGLFSATAETVLEVSIPKLPAAAGDQPKAEALQVVFAHDIVHGPLPIGADGSTEPALALINTRVISVFGAEVDIDEILQQVPELQDAFASTRVGFDGTAHGRMEIPTFALQDKEESVSFGGLSATSDYNRDSGSLIARLEMPYLDLRFADGSLQWQGISYDLDLVEVLPLLFVGSADMQLGGMAMEITSDIDSAPSAMVAKEFRLTSDSAFADGMVHGSQAMVFDGITVDGETFGPLEIDLEMKNLDGQALSDYQRNVWRIYGDMSQFDPDTMFAELIPEYSNLALKLMAGSPELNLNRIYLNTPMGELNGAIKLSYAHPEQDAPADLASLQQYVPYFNAAADLNVDQQLFKSVMQNNVKSQIQAAQQAARAQGRQVMEMNEAELETLVDQQIDMQLQMFATQGLVERDGERISSRITFSGGELQVNGQPLPVFNQ